MLWSAEMRLPGAINSSGTFTFGIGTIANGSSIGESPPALFSPPLQLRPPSWDDHTPHDTAPFAPKGMLIGSGSMSGWRMFDPRMMFDGSRGFTATNSSPSAIREPFVTLTTPVSPARAELDTSALATRAIEANQNPTDRMLGAFGARRARTCLRRPAEDQVPSERSTSESAASELLGRPAGLEPATF